jgi:XTP/dITP diphosphohydrolase
MENKIKLLIATSNSGKIIELRDLLSQLPFQVILPKDIGILEAPKETGSTYLENAELKAKYYFGLSRMPVLADDTGLEVDALNGQPGLYSARFSSSKDAGDADRRQLLLEKLYGMPKPWTAHFTCTAVFINRQGQIHSATGRCEGEIVADERGNNGFGYDPIFYFPDLGKTMAELELDEKNLVSHRARAIQAIIPRLRELFP